ncbi:MAG: GTP pyrophosphokinase family protein [Lachnospiraceae bacterium]|nr:GTP pyrophosphokinase family protein [Lachnospiraceae bacterium]
MKDEAIKKLEEVTDEELKNFISGFSETRQIMAYYRCAMMEIETKFKVLNEEFSMQQNYNPIETIKSRLKSPESIAEKMRRRNLPMKVETIEKEMHDIAGIRVICPFITDIYMLAGCLLKQDDICLLEKKNYIKNPKENGYRSLHLIVETPIFLQNEKRYVKVEIQFRTIAMDFWASLEHRLRYKKEIDSEIAGHLATELKECADTSAALDRKMERIKDDIEQHATNKEENWAE